MNEKLKNEFDFNDIKISFSDFDIIGTTEVFYSQASRFRISYQRHSKIVEYLTKDEIKKFCDEEGLKIKDIVFDLSVKIIDDEHSSESYKLINFIDHADNEENAVIIRGKWYKYNDDYIDNLHKSLKDLFCEHLSMYDFNNNDYENFIEQLYIQEKDKPKYKGKDKKKYNKLTKKNILSRKIL